jgi:hypothetical protein
MSAAMDESTVNRFEIYPNPMSGRCTLKFRADVSNTTCVQVFNVFGQIIRSNDCKSVQGRVECVIDLSDQSAGVYIVRVEMDGAMIVRMLIRD